MESENRTPGVTFVSLREFYLEAHSMHFAKSHLQASDFASLYLNGHPFSLPEAD